MTSGASRLRGVTLLVGWLIAAGELLSGPHRGTALLAAVAAVLALGAVVAPASLLPSGLLLALVGEHLAADAGPRAVAALAGGAALWCLHALLDLCAAAPVDADVDRTVAVRWLQRQGAVLATALPVGALVLVLGGLAPAGRALPWAGLLAAAALVAAPVLLLRLSRR